MWWNRIIEWFTNNKERNKFLNDFNKSAKQAFIMDVVPIFLKAESSFGNNAFKHQFSSFLYHGLKIRTMTGAFLADSDFINIGNMLASNPALTRQLVTLGYDTLEIKPIVYREGVEDADLSRRFYQNSKTVYFPTVSVVHLAHRESHKSIKLMRIHLHSAILYFNKWGWLFDSFRKSANK